MDSDRISAGGPLGRPDGHEAAETRHTNGPLEHPEVRYEEKDIRWGCILALIVTTCVIGAVMYFAVWRFYWSQEAAEEKAKRSPYPMAPVPSTALPPEPRLEELDRGPGLGQRDRRQRMTPMTTDEATAADKQLADEETQLNHYGPTAEKGFVHIPIEEAIKEVAGHLPVDAKAAPGRDANGLLDAGQSNSGRMFQGPLP